MSDNNVIEITTTTDSGAQITSVSSETKEDGSVLVRLGLTTTTAKAGRVAAILEQAARELRGEDAKVVDDNGQLVDEVYVRAPDATQPTRINPSDTEYEVAPGSTVSASPRKSNG